MFNLRTSIMIEAPIERVFEYTSTPENDFKWQDGTLATATIANGYNGKGVYFRSIGHLMGRRNLGTYEVVESNPNMTYGFKSLSGPLFVQTMYTFETVGNGTKVYISIRIGVVNFFHMNERTLERWMKKQLKENLAVLKGLLEVKQLPSLYEMPMPAM